MSETEVRDPVEGPVEGHTETAPTPASPLLFRLAALVVIVAGLRAADDHGADERHQQHARSVLRHVEDHIGVNDLRAAALHHRPVDLALVSQRVDDGAHVLRGHEPQQRDRAALAVDLDLRDLSANALVRRARRTECDLGMSEWIALAH